MSDTIRWCYTHKQPQNNCDMDDSLMYVKHDVHDALVIRADQPVYRVDQWQAEHGDIDGRDATQVVDILRQAGVLVRIGTETSQTCEHEMDGNIYTSDPPQMRCKKCGDFYWAKGVI